MGKDGSKKTGSNGLKTGLPSLDVKVNQFLDVWNIPDRAAKGDIPKASMVYGVAAALLFTIALYYFFTRVWFTGLLVFVLAATLFGYALFFLKNPD